LQTIESTMPSILVACALYLLLVQ